MTFEEILPHLRSGKKVRRTSWHKEYMKNLQEFMWYDPLKYSPGHVLRKLFGDNKLSAEDLDATDWEIYRKGDNKL